MSLLQYMLRSRTRIAWGICWVVGVVLLGASFVHDGPPYLSLIALPFLVAALLIVLFNREDELTWLQRRRGRTRVGR